MVAPASGAVMSSLHRGAADPVCHLGKRLARRRDVDGDDARAVASQGGGDGGADATGGTRDDDDLAVEGAVAQALGGLVGGGNRPRLPVHERGASLEHEAQRGHEVAGAGIGFDVQERGGGAAAQAPCRRCG
ncbi:hypothetical protein GCM10025876_37350 [Demequina litorisediminis]|uniref:Uncharacterized protein n=1 Tax=Demequina litorisediminis TaxID=1849022 RepID=A0ABQ6IKA5_9MICO|nr:hypothetical protein GCM10025876_37350 [Demequina litorisediminis]